MSENTNTQATENTSETSKAKVNQDLVRAAVAKAKANREAAKRAAPPKEEGGTPGKRGKLSDAEREAKLAQLKLERAERKAARQAKSAAKKAEREAARAAKPAHMGKVLKAAERLPALGEIAQASFDEITANFGREEIASLAQHLLHFNRAQATLTASQVKLQEGDTVRITGGDPRYIGLVGGLSKVQRIRCYVAVPELDREVYCFTSDVELVTLEDEDGDEAEVTLDEGEELEATGTEA